MQESTVKIYPRKQISKWVEKQGKCKLQDIRNGVFLCQALSQVLQQQIKFNPHPKSDFQCECNLNLFNKAIHKHKLSLDFDPQIVLQSKNHFGLTNWLKNLVEGNIRPPPQTPVRPESSSKEQNNNRKQSIPRLLSPSAMKKTQMTEELMLGIPRMADSPSLKALERRSSVERSTKSKASFVKSDYEDEDYSALMEEMALEDTISGLEKILLRVRNVVEASDQFSTFQLYTRAIQAAIFDKEAPVLFQ